MPHLRRVRRPGAPPGRGLHRLRLAVEGRPASAWCPRNPTSRASSPGAGSSAPASTSRTCKQEIARIERNLISTAAGDLRRDGAAAPVRDAAEPADRARAPGGRGEPARVHGALPLAGRGHHRRAPCWCWTAAAATPTRPSWACSATRRASWSSSSCPTSCRGRPATRPSGRHWRSAAIESPSLGEAREGCLSRSDGSVVECVLTLNPIVFGGKPGYILLARDVAALPAAARDGRLTLAAPAGSLPGSGRATRCLPGHQPGRARAPLPARRSGQPAAGTG